MSVAYFNENKEHELKESSYRLTTALAPIEAVATVAQVGLHDRHWFVALAAHIRIVVSVQVVTELVGDGEGKWEAVVLVDVAARLRVADAA
jgi:hypothetical protein